MPFDKQILNINPLILLKAFSLRFLFAAIGWVISGFQPVFHEPEIESAKIVNSPSLN